MSPLFVPPDQKTFTSGGLCSSCQSGKHQCSHYGCACTHCCYGEPLPPPAGAAPRDEARDLDPMLRATAHWPPLTDDQLQMLAAEGALGSIAAVEILRLRAAAPRADPVEDEPEFDEGELHVALHLCWLARHYEEQAEKHGGTWPDAAKALRWAARAARLLADSQNAYAAKATDFPESPAAARAPGREP